MVHTPGFLKVVEDAKKSIQEVTCKDVADATKKNEKFILVDVREDDEFREVRAKGALHLGKGVIERDIENVIPDKNSKIILYCGGGGRSALAAESILKMGYKNVASLDGGIRAWLAAGYPTES